MLRETLEIAFRTDLQELCTELREVKLSIKFFNTSFEIVKAKVYAVTAQKR